MRSKAGCLFMLMIICDTLASDVFKIVPKLYEEIGCSMKKHWGGSMSVKCPKLNKYDRNKCYLHGNSYKIGEKIHDDDSPRCTVECRCVQFKGKAAHIQCPNIECPEVSAPGQYCISQYDNLNDCCPIDVICDTKQIKSLKKCSVDGFSYNVGERWSPLVSGYECLCTADYNNEIPYAKNPNCKKIQCHMELKLNELRAGCVPLYDKTPENCPIDYKCPSENDVIESRASANEKKTCKFGRLTLKRGDILQSEDHCSKCECSVPPYLTCIRICEPEPCEV